MAMTDEQIVKDFECCIHGKEGFVKVLDLIKRQQAEIYNLKEDLSEYRNMPILTKNDCLIATVEKRADGKQYHNALLTIKVDEIRAEAYKEFAEGLKQYLLLRRIGQISVVPFEKVDNLLKELTEGSK